VLGALVLAASLSVLAAGAASLDLLRGGDAGGGRTVTVCSFRTRTGLPCLGCGGTRALARMSRGDWRGALAANPLGAYAGAGLWLLVAGGAAAAASGRWTFVGAPLALLAALAPMAFVWNAVAWWLALPPGR
jgi:hypothetical protein